MVVDDRVRLEELICDGVLLSTPAGSTAYNLSAHGPILPLEAPLLALTPVSPFRPRRWPWCAAPNKVTVDIEILEPEKRPVNAVADHIEVKSVVKVRIAESENKTAHILSDPVIPGRTAFLRNSFQTEVLRDPSGRGFVPRRNALISNRSAGNLWQSCMCLEACNGSGHQSIQLFTSRLPKASRCSPSNVPACFRPAR